MAVSIDVEPFETYGGWDYDENKGCISLSFFGTPIYDSPAAVYHEEDEDGLVELAKEILGAMVAAELEKRVSLDENGRLKMEFPAHDPS